MDQLAFDNQVVQEIFWDLKPDVVIESGTFMGGSALYYATILDQINPKAKIITIDIKPVLKDASQFRLFRDHVISLKGMSTDTKVVEQVRKLIPHGAVVFVTLDSDHSKDNVLRELNIYSKMVTVNSYLVCQDTNINGHPVLGNFGPGPFEAVTDFLKTNHDFVIDHSKEKYLATHSPSGFLKRIR